MATTRSPTSKPRTVPVPGFSTAFSARFSAWVPAGPLCTGVTTWIWSPSQSKTRGIESVTSCTTRWAASSDPRAGTTTTSWVGSSTGTRSPARTAIASRAIAPPSVCRYSVLSSVTGHACRCRSGRPAPGRARSTAAAPDHRRSPGGCRRTARGSARRRVRRPASRPRRRRPGRPRSGCSASRSKTEPVAPGAGGRAPSNRCTVVALLPASSSSRFAARPVGAASAIDASTLRQSATMAATVRLLPVPGPPVSRLTPCAAASETAPACTSSKPLTAALDGPLAGHRGRRPDQPGNALRRWSDSACANTSRAIHGSSDPVGSATRDHRRRRRSRRATAARRRRRTVACRRPPAPSAPRCARPGRTGPASTRPAPGRAAGRPGGRRARWTWPAGRPARPRRPAAPAAATGRRAAPSPASSPSASASRAAQRTGISCGTSSSAISYS